MNSDFIDDYLRSSREAPPFASLSAQVWQEIDRRKRSRFRLRVFMATDWADLLGEPLLLVSAIALAVIMGVVPAALSTKLNDAGLVRQSLHFEVFSASTAALFASSAATRQALAQP